MVNTVITGYTITFLSVPHSAGFVKFCPPVMKN